MENTDILSIVVSFINDIKTLLSIKHLTKITLNYKFIANFIYESCPFLIIKHVFTKTGILYHPECIISLTIAYNLRFNYHLPLLPKLEYLHCINITDENLMKIPSLTLLNYSGEQITDKSVSTLTNLTNLHCLSPGVTDYSLKYLTKLKILSQNKNFTPHGLKYLTNLNIYNTHMNNHSNEELQCLPNLVEINCDHLVDDKYITNRKSLEYLSAVNTNLTNSAFYGLTNLHHLCITGNEYITEEIFYHLPKLSAFIIYNSMGGIKSFDNCNVKEIVFMYIYFKYNIDLHKIKKLNKIVFSSCQYTSLVHHNIKNIITYK
jgi:hypothetical protein